MKEKLTQKEILKKVKKIIEIIGEDSKEARKIIKILKASYDFRKNQLFGWYLLRISRISV